MRVFVWSLWSLCADESFNIVITRYKSDDATSKNSAGVLVQSVNHATGKNTWKVILTAKRSVGNQPNLCCTGDAGGL